MKIIKSSEIENELNQTTKRLDELAEMRNGINDNLKILQDGFVVGKTDFDKTQAEQARLDTLNSSIKSLETKQGELQTAYDESVKSEALQTLLESATEAAVEAQNLFNELLEMRHEFAKAVGEFAEKLCDKFYAFRLKKKEYAKLRSQMPANTGTPDISDDVRDLVERNYENLPPIKYADVVLSAVAFVGEERYKQEIAKSRAG